MDALRLEFGPDAQKYPWKALGQLWWRCWCGKGGHWPPDPPAPGCPECYDGPLLPPSTPSLDENGPTEYPGE